MLRTHSGIPQQEKIRLMARRPRAARLETRTARLKLPVRRKPHDFTTISPGIALGYSRCASAGRWVVKVADGHGGHWTKALESVRKHQAGLQSFRSMRRIEASRRNASALRLRFSQSFASLRQRLSQAKVRSTT